MDIKKRQVNPIYFCFLSIFTIINTIMLIRFILTIPFHRIICHLTIWSYILSTIYFYSIFIADANLYLFKSTSLEKFNTFIRNYFSVIVYPYNYTITLEFWLILFLGSMSGKNPFYEQEKIPFVILYESFYLHLFMFIVLLIDLFCTKRKLEKSKTLSLIINFIFFWYCVIVLTSNYVFFIPAYPFMKDAGVMTMVIIFIISIAMIYFSYYLHLFLVKKINKDNEMSFKKII